MEVGKAGLARLCLKDGFSGGDSGQIADLLEQEFVFVGFARILPFLPG